jgi:2-desacetyl-2-hydroxyethyl bacteriochlorophyllide A dehydrogenase
MKTLNVVVPEKNMVELREEDVPPVGPGQILTKSLFSLISTGTELMILTGNFAPGTHWHEWIKYPFTPGYSCVGRVLETGPGVSGFSPGQIVAVRDKHRQFQVSDSRTVFEIPEGIVHEDATFFALGAIVQIGLRAAQHEMGDSVVVLGQGLLGQLTVQYARATGARQIIAIDPSAARLRFSRNSGATDAIESGAEQARDVVAGLTGGRMADVVYDITGRPAVFPSALRLARTFGKVVLLGDAGNPSEQRLTSDVIVRGLHVIGAHDLHTPAQVDEYHFWTKANIIAVFFDYLQRGQLSVNPLITHRFAARQAPDAYRMLLKERENAMGVILDWSKV